MAVIITTKLLWKTCLLQLIVISIVNSQISDNDFNGGGQRSYVDNVQQQQQYQRQYIRQPRFIGKQPSNGGGGNGIFGFFSSLRYIKNIYDEQYNDTRNALQQVMNLVSDTFSDTTAKPKNLKSSNNLATTTTTTENPIVNGTTGATTTTEKPKYRISREELGYILGKNYRGLQKLLRIEFADAQNQSRYTINDYRRDFGRALVPYTIIKNKRSSSSNKSKF